eukprot:10840883-Alexandrium_andersonii.AAC.1
MCAGSSSPHYSSNAGGAATKLERPSGSRATGASTTEGSGASSNCASSARTRNELPGLPDGT